MQALIRHYSNVSSFDVDALHASGKCIEHARLAYIYCWNDG